MESNNSEKNITNCRFPNGNPNKASHLKRKYVPSKWQTANGGKRIADYHVSIAEKGYGYSGSAYEATKFDSEHTDCSRVRKR